MNIETFNHTVLVLGWVVVVLMGVVGVVSFAVVMYEDHIAPKKCAALPERRVGPADRRAHAETR
jgi:hypothetical protein